MEISELTIRVLLLFFPGIICAILVDSVTIHDKRNSAFFLIYSFVYGIGSYLLLAPLPQLCGLMGSFLKPFSDCEVSFFSALFDSNIKINWKEIMAASIMAIIEAFIISGIITHGLVNRIARRFRVSRKSGKLDVWHFSFDSPDVRWVVVRDIAHDLVFEGWVQGFSDTARNPELLMREVRIYRNSTGEQLYEVGGLYISRDQKDITIEMADFGYTIPKEGGKKDEQDN
jgi:hypothetical protein